MAAKQQRQIQSIVSGGRILSVALTSSQSIVSDGALLVSRYLLCRILPIYVEPTSASDANGVINHHIIWRVRVLSESYLQDIALLSQHHKWSFNRFNMDVDDLMLETRDSYEDLQSSSSSEEESLERYKREDKMFQKHWLLRSSQKAEKGYSSRGDSYSQRNCWPHITKNMGCYGNIYVIICCARFRTNGNCCCIKRTKYKFYCCFRYFTS